MTPKNESESVCWPIFAQFVNWRYVTMLEDSSSFMLTCKLHVTLMFTKRLTTRRDEALKRRKELLEEDLL